MHLFKMGTLASLCLAVLSAAAFAADDHPPIHVNHPALKKLNWQMAVAASTFGEMTIFEMIELMHSLDAHHFELSPGQVVSPEHKDVKLGPEMPDADVDALLAKLKSVKMDIVTYGPVEVGADEAAARKIFEFGKRLKVKAVLVGDRQPSMEMIDHVASDVGVNAAIFVARLPGSSDAKISTAAVLKSIEGRSARVGLCVDLASLRRDGIPPAEGVKQLAGHIMTVRLGDYSDTLNEVPVGAGVVDVGAALAALKEQGFKGVCTVKFDKGDPHERLVGWIESVNTFSDMLDKVAETGGATK